MITIKTTLSSQVHYRTAVKLRGFVDRVNFLIYLVYSLPSHRYIIAIMMKQSLSAADTFVCVL